MEPTAGAPMASWDADARVVWRRALLYAAVLAAAAGGHVALQGPVGWVDSGGHVVIESLAAGLALVLGVLALVRFYSRKNNVFLFLGTGFLATAALDAYHALLWLPFLGDPVADPARLAEWSWVASRTVLAAFFVLNWLGWRRERRLGQAGRVGERIVYVGTALLTTGAVLALHTLPLPSPWAEFGPFVRPDPLLPGALFLIALIGYLAKAHWKDNAFDHWLVLSLVLGFAGEALFTSFSATPYDAPHAVAHALKLASYLCVTVGVLTSVYLTFRQAEENAAALAREVVERERAQAEAEVQKAYLEKLFESAPEAIVVLDEGGRIVRMNDEFTRMFGWGRRVALERPIEELIVPDDRRAEARGWQDRVLRGQTVGYETVRRREDGSVVDVSVLGTAIAVEPGETAIYEIYRDITARKRAEEELRQAKEAAEAATRAKSEFLATMSHELRTPLNSVIGFANVLLKSGRDRLEEREATFLERIRENGLHLLRLINDVLDLSKIEAGKMALTIEPVALDELVRETVGQFRGPAFDGSVQLEVEVPDGLTPLETDRGKLKQVLINLVGNALKFTERGRVVVRVTADAAGVPARIEVEDTGIGIPPHRLRAIFEAFEQAETGTARSYGGTGLGLAISSRLCSLLGYDLTVGSELGRGAVFSVVLGGEGEAGLELASDALVDPAGKSDLSV
ncbi:MAG TPA: ATP-binding protein [Gemmatimonadota bacterium]|nr:ATP-binding protein [Gemmatimonadota bacterium]